MPRSGVAGGLERGSEGDWQGERGGLARASEWFGKGERGGLGRGREGLARGTKGGNRARALLTKWPNGSQNKNCCPAIYMFLL